MRDLSLLNELELKIRELVVALEREKARNGDSKRPAEVSSKLSEIEGRVKNLINLIEQMDT